MINERMLLLGADSLSLLPLFLAEMRLHGGDVWGHFAPMFHLVDVFAIYAMTLLGGRHVIVPTFHPTEALLTIGKPPCTSHGQVCHTLVMHCWFACA
jgi:hypothetical protein